MKTKNLALTNGLVGLIGGIVLLLGAFVILGTAAATASGDATSGAVIILNLLKVAELVLGIIGAVYYRGDDRVGVAPAVLLIVGGAISLVPFLGWIGGILAIIGGSLYLGTLKKFREA